MKKSIELVTAAAQEDTILLLGFQEEQIVHVTTIAKEKKYQIKYIGHHEEISCVPNFLTIINEEYAKQLSPIEHTRFKSVELHRLNEEMTTVIIYGEQKPFVKYECLLNGVQVNHEEFDDYDYCKGIIVQAKADYQKRKKYKERKNNKVKYLIFTYKYLKTRKELSVLELAQILKISYRTAQRYLQEIEESTAAISYDAQSNRWVYQAEEDEIITFLDEVLQERGGTSLPKYTRSVIDRELQHWPNELDELHKNKGINWRGVTSDTSEYFTELAAKKLHAEGLVEHLAFIQPIKRKASYHVNTNKASSKKMASTKLEDIIAMQLYQYTQEKEPCPILGKVWDYTIPLKNKSTDRDRGTIDLMTIKSGTLWLLEIKPWNSSETALRSLLEVNINRRLLDMDKLLSDYAEVWGAQKINRVATGLLVFANSQSGEEFVEMKKGLRKHLSQLTKELDTKVFLLRESDEGHPYSFSVDHEDLAHQYYSIEEV